MKKLAIGLALALASNASATTWEYAQYLDIPGIGVVWSASEGAANGKNISELLTNMKCDQKGMTGFLNCVGAQGWELVAINTKVDSVIALAYVFKRPKP